ncbi:CU044_5270 family protein [Actinomadura gamaensis]|uniref:CU044_5270 family protein n=1 Tax=Actinomadura gamaensis TaxID=1763541 RepID=A0ABV9TZ00_9ACTN
MDDDLRLVADALTKPDPAQDVVDRRRHQLQNAMRGGAAVRPRHRRVGWMLGSAGLTGVAAAGVAVALVAGTSGTPGTSTHRDPPTATAAAPASARQVFLTAAETAAREPERVGTYWHLTMITKDAQGRPVPDDGFEQWFRHDGRHYSSGLKSDWKPWFDPKQEPGFRIGGPVLGFAALRSLPSEPSALVARLTELVQAAHIRTSAGELDAAGRRVEVLNDLFVLATQSPVTERVRAAAFRALAAAPEVKSLGRSGGGVRLNIPVWNDPQGLDVTLDPTTGRLRDSRSYVDWQGGLITMGDGRTVSITAEWTDTLPKITGPRK